MRISDWSSDVCSSDLSARTLTRDGYEATLLGMLQGTRIDGPSLVIDVRQDEALVHAVALQEFCSAMVPAGVQLCLSQYSAGPEADALLAQMPLEIGRASCRARVCQSVWSPVVA